MPNAIADIDYIKTAARIPTTVPDAAVVAWAEAAEQAVKDYIGFDPTYQPVEEFHDGDSSPYVRLRRRPARLPEVWLNQGGFYGKGSDTVTVAQTKPLSAVEYTTALKLVEGTDYVLVRDENTDPAVSRSGLIRKIGGAYGFAGAWPYGSIFDYGGDLIPRTEGPVWPRGVGNILVKYTAGFNPIPAPIRFAVALYCDWLRVSVGTGGVIKTSESLGNYSYSGQLVYQMTAGQISTNPALSRVRQQLDYYRNWILAA